MKGEGRELCGHPDTKMNPALTPLLHGAGAPWLLPMSDPRLPPPPLCCVSVLPTVRTNRSLSQNDGLI